MALLDAGVYLTWSCAESLLEVAGSFLSCVGFVTEEFLGGAADDVVLVLLLSCQPPENNRLSRDL